MDRARAVLRGRGGDWRRGLRDSQSRQQAGAEVARLGEMNLPNALTVARIVATPLIAVLPLFDSAAARLTAFILFVFAAVTDYVDGYLARSRKEETDLGRLLDPAADKLLL